MISMTETRIKEMKNNTAPIMVYDYMIVLMNNTYIIMKDNNILLSTENVDVAVTFVDVQSILY